MSKCNTKVKTVHEPKVEVEEEKMKADEKDKKKEK